MVGGKQVDPKATFIFGCVLRVHTAHQLGQQVQLLLGQQVRTVICLQWDIRLKGARIVLRCVFFFFNAYRILNILNFILKQVKESAEEVDHYLYRRGLGCVRLHWMLCSEP